MIYLVAVLGYCLVVWLLVRFFDVAHSWDEEAHEMMERWLEEAKKKAA